MVIGNHDDGFEKETRLKEIWLKVRDVNQNLYQWSDVMAVARLKQPELCEGFDGDDGAFERRPCKRMLRYIGYDSWPEPDRTELNAEKDTFFVHGEIYTSTSFNGATYSVDEYSKLIGCAYFEWVQDEV